MKIFLSWAALAVVLYVLQGSLMPLIFFHGIGPDLIMLMTISFAFIKGNRQGSFAGFMLGLFEDMATGGFFGTNTFVNMVLGFVCGTFSNRVLRDSFFLPVFAALLGTVFSGVFMELVMVLLGYGFHPIAHLQLRLLPMLCYNLVFAWPVHVLVHRVDDLFAEKK